MLLILTVFAFAYIFVQNYIGIAIANFFNLNPALGILAGSAPLQGGHGNIVQWVPVLNGKIWPFELHGNRYDIGYFWNYHLGGLAGPVAKFLINKHNLKPEDESEDSKLSVGAKHGQTLSIDYDSMLLIILMLAFSIGIGIYFHKFLEYINFTLPLFATCMLGGLILANVVPLISPKLKCPPS